MKIPFNQFLKISLILIVFSFNTATLKGQEKVTLKDNRIYTSLDLTFFGPQASLAYDFYSKKGRCFGISISQLNGLKQVADENTIYYNFEDIRLNLSFRYTSYLYQGKRSGLFGILQAGISYNTTITGKQLILPSFRAGGGIDFIIIKGSGIRIEAGMGSPYAASIGYFFKM